MLRLVSDQENVEQLLTVNQRLKDIDSGHIEYELCCPSKTGYYQYHQDDVDDLFVGTGLTSEEIKPIMDDEIRSLYQSMCSHSWTQTGSGSYQCIHCRMRVPYPDEDHCTECGDSDLVGLNSPKDEVAPLVCIRHGTIMEVEAVAE